jgi:hypothetical protein
MQINLVLYHIYITISVLKKLILLPDKPKPIPFFSCSLPRSPRDSQMAHPNVPLNLKATSLYLYSVLCTKSHPPSHNSAYLIPMHPLKMLPAADRRLPRNFSDRGAQTRPALVVINCCSIRINCECNMLAQARKQKTFPISS